MCPRQVRRCPSARGSILPIGLALLFLGAMVIVRQHSVGELYSTKQRLTSAADSAAYGAAIWQARVLNFHAYANRAILANEVAIAQAVTLVAWANYFNQFANNADTLSPVIPYLGPFLHEAAQSVELMNAGVRLGAAAEVTARNGWQQALRTSQDLLALSTHHFALNSVANEVARANDSRFFAWVLPGANVTVKTAHVDESGRHRFAQLVTDSLDPFVKGSRQTDIALPLPSGCLISARAQERTPWLRKRGGTVLSGDLSNWEGVDTLSFHMPVRRAILIGRCNEVETPLGWGSNVTRNGVPVAPGIQNPDQALWKNAKANNLAARAQSVTNGYGGLISIRELSARPADGNPSPVAQITVLARSEVTDLRTSSQIGVGSGRLALPDQTGGNRLWAMASSEVYFHRPASAPKRLEYASLFNPYWQVRMVPTPAAQSLVAGVMVQADSTASRNLP